MNGLNDFLESSTIHGLTYLSTAKSSAQRLFWLAIVFTGFLTAGLLIQASFGDWENNPVATNIQTLPISKSKFPREFSKLINYINSLEISFVYADGGPSICNPIKVIRICLQLLHESKLSEMLFPE